MIWDGAGKEQVGLFEQCDDRAVFDQPERVFTSIKKMPSRLGLLETYDGFDDLAGGYDLPLAFTAPCQEHHVTSVAIHVTTATNTGPTSATSSGPTFTD